MKNNVILTVLFYLINLNISMAQPSHTFQIQGHRGCRGLMPENTLQAFLRAIDEDVHTLELDVVISKDKKVVVSHDPFFDPGISTTPDGLNVTQATSGNIYRMNYSEVITYDVGKRGNANFPEQKKVAAVKPLLSDVIREAEKYAKAKGIKNLKYNIEIKSLEKEYNISQPEVGVFSDLVAGVLKNKISPERISIQSFDFGVLKHWHKQIQAGLYPKVLLSALIEPEDDNDINNNLEKLGFKPDIWSPNFTQVTKDRVNQLHNMHIRVIPWTVNKPEDMKKIKALGCDGLITDYPDRVKDL